MLKVTSPSTLTFDPAIPQRWRRPVEVHGLSPVVGDDGGVPFLGILGSPSTNTQHPLQLHLIIFTLNFNSLIIDPGAGNSGRRQEMEGAFSGPSLLAKFVFFFFATVAK